MPLDKDKMKDYQRKRRARRGLVDNAELDAKINKEFEPTLNDGLADLPAWTPVDYGTTEVREGLVSRAKWAQAQRDALLNKINRKAKP